MTTNRRNNEYTAEAKRIDKYLHGQEFVNSKEALIRAADNNVHEVDIVQTVLNSRRLMMYNIEDILLDIPSDLSFANTPVGSEWIHRITYEIIEQSGDLKIPDSLTLDKYIEVVERGLPKVRREVEVEVEAPQVHDLPDKSDNESSDNGNDKPTTSSRRHERPKKNKVVKVVEEPRRLSSTERWIMAHQFEKTLEYFERCAEVERCLRIKNENQASDGYHDRRKVKFTKSEVFATIANTLYTGVVIGAVTAVKAAVKKGG